MNKNTELETFINDYCDFTKNIVTNEVLKMVEDGIGIKFGTQLTEYIMRYGYLGFEDKELYGLNSLQGMNSDLFEQTMTLHDYFAITKPYICREKVSEHGYALIDSNDNIYLYNTTTNELKELNIKLYDYILKRFKGELV